MNKKNDMAFASLEQAACSGAWHVRKLKSREDEIVTYN